MGHEMKDCQGTARPAEGQDYVGEEPSFGEEQKYIFVRSGYFLNFLILFSFYIKLETYQAMPWFSSDGLVQKKCQYGNIGIFSNGHKNHGKSQHLLFLFTGKIMKTPCSIIRIDPADLTIHGVKG